MSNPHIITLYTNNLHSAEGTAQIESNGAMLHIRAELSLKPMKRQKEELQDFHIINANTLISLYKITGREVEQEEAEKILSEVMFNVIYT